MDDVFSTVVAIIVSTFLLFMIPTYNAIEKNQQAMDTYVYTEMVDLVNRIRNTGCLSHDMYMKFMNSISNTGVLYEIQFQHFSEMDDGMMKETYFPQIKDVLEREKVYYFQEGDTIRMRIMRKNGKLTGYYGGRIKDENY